MAFNIAPETLFRRLQPADDDARAKALEFLQRRGAEVHIAENGREAVTRATAQDYDAILMDINMPEMDGFQLAEQIVADPARGVSHELRRDAGARAVVLDVDRRQHVVERLAVRRVCGEERVDQ